MTGPGRQAPPPARATLLTLAAVVAAALLGGALAGDPRQGPYAALVQPGWAPPLWLWALVGLLYYAAMGVALWRALRRGQGLLAGLVLLVMLANELWNLTLFVAARPDWAHLTLWPFLGLVLVALVVARRDRISAGLLLAYALWLGFDLAWTAALWRLASPVLPA